MFAWGGTAATELASGCGWPAPLRTVYPGLARDIHVRSGRSDQEPQRREGWRLLCCAFLPVQPILFGYPGPELRFRFDLAQMVAQFAVTLLLMRGIDGLLREGQGPDDSTQPLGCRFRQVGWQDETRELVSRPAGQHDLVRDELDGFRWRRPGDLGRRGRLHARWLYPVFARRLTHGSLPLLGASLRGCPPSPLTRPHFPRCRQCRVPQPHS